MYFEFFESLSLWLLLLTIDCSVDRSLSPPQHTTPYTHTPTVSLDLLMADFRQISKGIKEATGELINNKQNTALKTFCLEAEPKVTKLEKGLETAKVSSVLRV